MKLKIMFMKYKMFGLITNITLIINLLLFFVGICFVNNATDFSIEWVESQLNDSTITGIGRGPGNALTEELILEINQEWKV